ncbi:AraC family transcriptional regulator ligand-binding domain-containing protein [Ruegeria atlantica]|uniref:AraC family transcriptional regulator ligand-binding domain-containing protein n=1 Tax=Ruegeria atlantica TaxID=81569 RepID=UPI00249585E9|nr:AraC family transcriptional regulator [Ruegeria atlantica]
MNLPPMISAKSLGEMPGFTMEHLGARALDRAMEAAGLPHQFADLHEGYIPEYVLASFVQQVGQQLGEDNIGLLWAPVLTIKDYGKWGEYVLGAATLGSALARARNVMPLHSSGDSTQLRLAGNKAFYRYRFALRSHPAYSQIAFSALGSVLSIFRHFLGPHWRPTRLHCDMPPIMRADDAEIAFGCPIHWNKKALEICFPSHLLTAHAPAHPISVSTIEDIVRERSGGTPRDFHQVVESVLLMQLKEQDISIDRTAQALNLSVRCLQRKLEQENTTFRTLTNDVLVTRAKELLRHGGMSVKAISLELGYSSQHNFSRAFRDRVGLSPTQYLSRSVGDHPENRLRSAPL